MRTLKLIAAGVVVLVAVAILVPTLFRRAIFDPPGEAPPVGEVRVLNTALTTYQTAYGYFPDSLAELGPPAAGGATDKHAANLIDSLLASGTKRGYRFVYLPSSARPGGPLDSYALHADPRTGEHHVHLYSDESGQIRFERGKSASAASRPLN